MLSIDTTTMTIALTRGDTASIVFSAKDKEGRTFLPTHGDVLKFAVAKKVGADPLFEIQNTFDTVSGEMIPVTITEDEFNIQKTMYFILENDGGAIAYRQCTRLDTFDPDGQYAVEDYSAFWTIVIGANGEWYDESGADIFKFKDYVWDLQLITSTGVDTIIGKTDDISPTFRVLGEVATE